MKLATIGIDLAKNVFQVHGAGQKGKAVMKKRLKRTQVLPFFANMTSCQIGMEACGSPTIGQGSSRRSGIPCS